MTNCKSCHHPTLQKFCSNCGKQVVLERIDWNYIVHEVKHVLHFEKGFFYTIRETLVRPGKTVQEFISENRNRLVSPIIFVIITSLIYSVSIHLFDVQGSYIKFIDDGTAKKSSIVSIFNWINTHYGYANIMVCVFIAMWLKLFFRKHRYNYFEILILLCFVMGVGMLQFSVFAIFEGLTKISSMKFSALVFLPYLAWATGQFFDAKRPSSYFKGLAAYVIGMLSFSMVAVSLGFIVDFVLKIK